MALSEKWISLFSCFAIRFARVRASSNFIPAAFLMARNESPLGKKLVCGFFGFILVTAAIHLSILADLANIGLRNNT